MLRSISITVNKLGRLSSEDVFECIHSGSPSVEKTLRDTLELVPRAIASVLTDLFDSLDRPGLGAYWRSVGGSDPRNTRRLASSLDQTDRWLTLRPALRTRVHQAVGVLEEKGALGLESLQRIVVFLESLHRRPDGLHEAGGRALRVGDAVLQPSWLEAFQKSLLVHSKVWGPRAAAEVVAGFDEAAMGSVDPPRIEGSLPEIFGLIDGSERLSSWQNFSIKAPTECERTNLDRMYFAMFCLEKLTQRAWWRRFQPGLRFEAGTEPFYDPGTQAVVLPSDCTASISRTLMALLGALDHALLDGLGFASEKEGHPVALLAQLASRANPGLPHRDVFRRVVEQYLRLYMRQLGHPYAEHQVPGDASAHWVAAFSKTLMDALVEGQKLDLKHYGDQLEQSEEGNLIGSGGLAAVAAGFGMGLL